MPTSKTDYAAMVHDIDYLYMDQRLADIKAVKNAEWYWKPAMALSFAAKDVKGYNVPKNREVASQLYDIILKDPEYVSLAQKYRINVGTLDTFPNFGDRL